MIQPQKNYSPYRSMPTGEIIERHGKKFELIMKGGGQHINKKIREWIWDRKREYFILDPEGLGFKYLYAEVPA